jgi:putative peptidoglycan lipid II flippase
MSISILAKVLGLLRDLILSYVYGVSEITDAFVIATTIPGFFFSLIGGGLVAGYIPIYTEIKKKMSIKEADEFTSKVFIVLFVLVTVIVIFTLIFTREVVLLFASGFDQLTLQYTISFSKVTIISVYSSLAVTLLASYLNIYRKFYVSSLIGIPLNLIIILFIFISKDYSKMFLPYGYLIATFSQLLIIIPFVMHNKFQLKINFQENNQYINKLVKIAIPIFIGAAVYDINTLVDKTIASQVIFGGISILNYATRLTLFIQTIIVVSITTVYFPKFSADHVNENKESIRRTIQDSIIFALLIMIPATIGIIVLSEKIIEILYLRGSFNYDNLLITAKVLIFYSFSMLGFTIRHIIIRVYYSRGNSKTPLLNAIFTIVLNIMLNLLLYFHTNLGLGGLALATSVSFIISGIVLIANFSRNEIKLIDSFLISSLLKITGSAFTMGVIVYFLNGISIFSRNYLTFGILIILSIMTYFVLLIALREREVVNLLHIIIKRIKNILERRSNK